MGKIVQYNKWYVQVVDINVFEEEENVWTIF